MTLKLKSIIYAIKSIVLTPKFFLLILIFIIISNVQAQRLLPKSIISIKDKAEMVLIPEGPFISGMNQNDIRNLIRGLRTPMMDIYKSEFPMKNKILGNYYIDRYEVTNEQYERFMKETGHRAPKYWDWPQFNGKRQPVVGVGWEDAKAYCEWAGKRLPTEDEWEKAARGTEGWIWPWGNTPDEGNFNGREQANYGPVNVGCFPSGNSPYGISDMAGNVWEMTSGIWWKGKDKTMHTMRGGSFLNISPDVRVTIRWAAKNEKEGAEWLGFRCIMDVKDMERFSTKPILKPGRIKK
ncbi:MAG: SUMF1/EgtB/PvdO family nonheme iron enzyme [bacterium]